MAVTKPFRRTCRQFSDGSYSEGGRWLYLLHRKFAKDPQHYVRAFLLLQKDLLELFAYIEPAKCNRGAYSHRVQQLLMRACVEIEANLTAILIENGYGKDAGKLTMQDYRLVDRSHRLSSYEARIPEWRGAGGLRRPYAAWAKSKAELLWYGAYNKSKHNRHKFFHLATFDALVDAMCGLAIVLSAQFYDEDYSSADKTLGIGSSYGYYTDDGMQSAIGDYLRVKFPTDWLPEDRYEFNWDDLKDLPDPFDEFNYLAPGATR